MRVALDTNVLVYAEGHGDPPRCALARQWLAKLQPEDVVLPMQALGELQRVLVAKAGRSPSESRLAVQSWADAFDVAAADWSTMQSALDLCADHQLTMWDALILATAADARCRLLLTEDMQHGMTWRGVTLVNPFLTPSHPLLVQAAA